MDTPVFVVIKRYPKGAARAQAALSALGSANRPLAHPDEKPIECGTGLTVWLIDWLRKISAHRKPRLTVPTPQKPGQPWSAATAHKRDKKGIEQGAPRAPGTRVDPGAHSAPYQPAP
jgi:hypothetical protein